MFGENWLNYGLNGINGIDENKKKVDNVQQPQVAFINTIFEGFGGANSNSGSEAAFNA